MRIDSCSSRGSFLRTITERVILDRSARFLCAALTLVTLSACGNDNLDETQQLGPLRVLALIASSPEVNIGGGSVNITPWISDFDRGGEAGRSWSYSWKTCADSGIAFGAEPECSSDAVLQSGGPTTVAGGVLNLANAFTAPAVASIAVTIPAATDAFWTTRNDLEKTNGVPLIFQFTLTAGSETVTSFRRILVKAAGASNTNPTLSGVTVDGASIAGGGGALPTTEKAVVPVIDAGSQQSYSVVTTNGTTLNKTEVLTVSWFTTLGEFQFNRTDGASENTFTPPDSGTPKAIVFLRDDRGGISAPVTIGF